MLRSLLPFAKLFESPLRTGMPALSTTSKFFFATTPPTQKSNPAALTKSRKPNFPPPPPMEPMEEGDEQDRMQLTNQTYLETIGEKLYKNRRSAYASIERRGKIYHLYDAERIPVGRIVQEVVKYIQGKHSPLYRHERIVGGDTCVIVNADKMKWTGQKAFQKSIKYHTGYIGNLRTIPYKRMILEKPEQLIMRTIYKMLPKNKLREEYLKNVMIYRGPTHPLTQFLPNFGYTEENYDALISKVRGDYLNSKDYVVTYETTPGTFTEVKDYEREIDLSYERPFREENIKTPKSAQNKAVIEEQKKYKRLQKRYKEYKVKQPKYRDIVKEAQNDTVFIDREWKYKKLGLHKLGGDEDDPDED